MRRADRINSEMGLYYMFARDWLYDRVDENPSLKDATVDELADLILKDFPNKRLPSGIARTQAEKAARRVLEVSNKKYDDKDNTKNKSDEDMWSGIRFAL